MTQRIPLTSIAPDLRFGLAGMIAFPQAFPALGGVRASVAGRILAPAAVPAYLRYADRDAELIVSGFGQVVDVERELADGIHAIGESGDLGGLGMAVVVLDAIDSCFRDSGLWSGNIYLAGGRALTAAFEVAGADAGGCFDSVVVMLELAALELAYLFPVAGKFRSGRYDGQVQYRLNGWGRVLAGRLAGGRTGVRAEEFRRRIGRRRLVAVLQLRPPRPRRRLPRRRMARPQPPNPGRGIALRHVFCTTALFPATARVRHLAAVLAAAPHD
jgi:hypothetical protein